MNSHISSFLNQPQYAINILVNGKNIALHSHEGRNFIQGNIDSEYELEIKNNSSRRILAVCSVDGLDVLLGKEASDDSPGYIIDGYSNFRIKGFRVDNEKVAAFKFAKKEKSYAKEIGNGQNCGVIGVKFFVEKIKEPEIKIVEKHYHYDHYKPYPYWDYPWWNRPYYLGDVIYSSTCQNQGLTRSCGNSAEGLCGTSNHEIMAMNCSFASNDEPSFLGTAWGGAKESKVTSITFERAEIVFSTEIFYATRADLEKMGVPLKKEGKIAFPNAFPKNEYCKKPKDWTG